MPAALAVLAASGCIGPVQKISEGSLRNATARGAADQMRRIGHPIKGGMRCRVLTPDTLSVVRLRCAGRTTREEPVGVAAVARDANAPRPRQEFVITIAGREVVRAPCLGRGCRRRP